MKKILLMLALMLPCLGAWAQTTSLTITNFNAANTTWTKTDGSTLTSGWGYKVVVNNTDPVVTLQRNANANDLGWSTISSVRYAYLVQSKVYMLSVPEHCIIENFEIQTENANGYGGTVTYELQPNKYQIKISLSAGSGTAGVLVKQIKLDLYVKPSCNYTLTDDAGNEYSGTCYAVPGTAPEFAGVTVNSYSWDENNLSANITFPFPVSNAETTKKLMINGFTYSSQNFKWYAKDDTYIKVNENSVPTNETVDNYLWAIYPTFNEGEFTYTIKNIATDKFITSSATSRAHGDTTLEFAENGISFKLIKDATYGLAFKVSDKNLYLSINSSTDGTGEQPVGLWDGAHDGTSLKFIPYIINYSLTDTEGNTFTGEYEGWSDFQTEPTFTGVEGYTLSNQSWSGNTFSATITFPFTVSSASQANPIYIRQETNGTFDDDLWTAVAGKVTVVDGAPLLGASQWMIYPSLNGSEFTFKIKSVSAHKYVTATAEDEPITLTETGTSFNFIPTTNESYNGFAYTAGGKTLFVTSEPDVADKTPLGLAEANDTYVGNNVGFPEANSMNSFKVEIGAVGYTTVYAPFTAACFDDGYNPDFVVNGLKAYTIANKPVNDLIPLTPVHFDWGTVIPKNGAAILKGKGTYVFTLVEDNWYSGMEEAWEENWLKGTSVNTYIEGDAYVLSAPDGVESIGLYKAELNKNANGEAGTTHFLNNAGKAYLPAYLVEATAGALRFNFGGNTTAIESVLNNSADANAPIYDLSGRRVMNAVKGGIYIQNGKKFIVK